MQPQSRVAWASQEVPTEPAISALVSSIRKLSDRKKVAEQYGCPYEQLMTGWGDTINVRRHLFYVTEDGKQYPKYPPTIEQWKCVIKYYAMWHDRTKLSDLVNMWLDIADGVLGCVQGSITTDFALWVFSNQCKFSLLLRRETEPYDPENAKF